MQLFSADSAVSKKMKNGPNRRGHAPKCGLPTVYKTGVETLSNKLADYSWVT